MVKDTIFSPSFGNRPSHLLGREDVVQSFLQGLSTEPGNRERAVLLLGQRGSGKTVLLWELADRARDMGYVVANPTVASRDMLDRIIEKVQSDGESFYKKRSSHVTGGSIGALGFSAGLQFTREEQETKSFQYKLTQLGKALTEQGRGLLILVDELQANSPEIRQLVIAYQEIVGEQLNIALIMAGLPSAVSATLNDKVLTFLNRARKIVLAPLSLAEIDAFYARSFDELGLTVSPELRREATRATKGSPYMFQLVGHYIALYADAGEELAKRTLDDALYAAQSDYENDVCDTTLAALSEQDVRFLQAMSEDAQMSKMSEIAERMGVSQDYAQKYRKRLIDAGVIEAQGRGFVRFAVPYLADRLRNDPLF